MVHPVIFSFIRGTRRTQWRCTRPMSFGRGSAGFATIQRGGRRLSSHRLSRCCSASPVVGIRSGGDGGRRRFVYRLRPRLIGVFRLCLPPPYPRFQRCCPLTVAPRLSWSTSSFFVWCGADGTTTATSLFSHTSRARGGHWTSRGSPPTRDVFGLNPLISRSLSFTRRKGNVGGGRWWCLVRPY